MLEFDHASTTWLVGSHYLLNKLKKIICEGHVIHALKYTHTHTHIHTRTNTLSERGSVGNTVDWL